MEKKIYRSGLITGIIVTIIPVAIAAFFFGTYYKVNKVNLPADTVRKINTVLELIDDEYLFDYTDEDIETGLLKGLMNSLGDVYSEYYTADELIAAVNSSEGNICGIGVMVKEDEETGGILVSEVLEDGPAYENGIKDGDIITEIEGVKIPSEKTASEGMELIRGENGTNVTINVLRDGENIKFTLTRRYITTSMVSYGMSDDYIGYIQISQFTDHAAEEFKEAMDDLNFKGMKGLIIDVRSNPGGKLTSVLAISDYLMPEGLIMYEEDKKGNRQEYRSTDDTAVLNVPCAILTDENSASASEVFAGAMKDRGYAVTIGKKTYGKGIVQTMRMLSDGSGLKFTICHYFTPNGNDIHGVGIEPDVEADFDTELARNEGRDTQMEAAIEYIKGKI